MESSKISLIILFISVLFFLYYEKMQVQTVNFMEADEFYRTFKTFKDQLKEDGPEMVTKIMENHLFDNENIKVKFRFIRGGTSEAIGATILYFL